MSGWYDNVREAGKAQDYKNSLMRGIGGGLLGLIPGQMNSPALANEPPAIVQPATQPSTEPSVGKPATTQPSSQPVSIDINKIIQIESGGNRNARSTVGAVGIMQIMPRTWDELVQKMGKNWPQSDMTNPSKNKMVGKYYLNVEIPRLLAYSNVPDTCETRLAAYNWGAGNVSKAYLAYGDEWLGHAPQETQSYIKKYYGAGR